MIRKDRELLAELARVNSQATDFALAFMEGRLSREAQLAFGRALARLGETIMTHAEQRERLIIEGSVVNPAIVALRTPADS